MLRGRVTSLIYRHVTGKSASQHCSTCYTGRQTGRLSGRYDKAECLKLTHIFAESNLEKQTVNDNNVNVFTVYQRVSHRRSDFTGDL